jgi:uncharacterized protein (TIGR02466 family)
MAGLFFSCYNNTMKTLDLIHTPIFPTVLAHCVNSELALRMLPYAQSLIEANNNECNGFNYKNTYRVKSPDTLLQREFESFCTDVAHSYWMSIGIKDTVKGMSVFYSEMNKGSYHVSHIHPGTKLAGVFYLHAPEGGAKIRFHDPRPHTTFLKYNYNNNNPLLYTIYDIEPHTGLFLIFPAWLMHEVLQNNSDNKRTTAVFNIV